MIQSDVLFCGRLIFLALKLCSIKDILITMDSNKELERMHDVCKDLVKKQDFREADDFRPTEPHSSKLIVV